ncbi:putative copia-type polyprotein [Trifolium medium]|uniref:Putative copia-type polyprotein n=1 Tax=Trifolium medium TaxID=97028 RepID=A0A392MRM6_9FABA|nr:putative copia-type polyprotein [Trifolium medium]
MQAIEDNNTWELTNLPEGSKAIGVKWIFKTKYNEMGQIDKYKGSAFLHGDLTEDIYVEQPLGYQNGDNKKVYKLKKALYGLKQAPRAWYSKIESHFVYEGFEKCPSEHTLFVKYGDNNDIIIVSVYVDDLIVTGNNQTLISVFKQSMKKRFAMSDLGKMKYFLGVEVCQTDEGIFIHQMKYASEILTRFGMENCNVVSSPIVTGCKLVKNEAGKASDAKSYKQMVGSLMYLLATMPDLAFSVCLVARFMERPAEMHIAAIKRIMRYVKGTIGYGLLYKKTSDVLQLKWIDRF